MYASNSFEEKMLNLMRGRAFTAPSALYIALFLTNPADTGTGGTEAGYQGYARQLITFSAPVASGTGHSMQNSAEIIFPLCTGGASESIQYVGVFDSPSGGDMYLYGQLTSPLLVQQGVSPVFREGMVKWNWSGNLSPYYRQAIMNTLRGANSSVSGFSPSIALFNGDPISGGGREFSGNNYARIPVTMSEPTQDSAGPAISENTAGVYSAVSSGAWGTLANIAIMDDTTNGNIFLANNISPTYAIGANASIGFNAGVIKVSID